MNLPRKCTATKALLGLLLCAASALSWAQVAGTVVNLSGPLLARKASGAVKVLTTKSEVENGDTLISEKNTYARIRFIDDSEVTLRPGSQFKIENFAYDEGQPEKDSAVFNLIKGGLRSVTGALGKRNKERYGLKTPTATIGIRGTTFIAEYVPPSDAQLAAYAMASTAQVGGGGAVAPLPAGGVPAGPGGRAPGLYVQVLDGMINLSNNGGAQNFAAGQFGFTPSVSAPPVVLPANPGIQFTPPPAFQAPATGPQASATGDSGKSGNIDCEVR